MKKKNSLGLFVLHKIIPKYEENIYDKVKIILTHLEYTPNYLSVV
jgi:hypothetical protein